MPESCAIRRLEPLLEYIESLDAAGIDDYVTIVLPEFVPARWWHHLFSVPFHLAR